MEMTAVLIVTATIFLWGTVSARLERADLTAPIVFTVIGGLLAATDLVDGPSAPETLKPLVELTLVWVLFSDAARIPIREVRRDLGRYLRLLGIGLPLTILAGWGLPTRFFPSLGIWLAILVAAAPAPPSDPRRKPRLCHLLVRQAITRQPVERQQFEAYFQR